MNKAKIGEIAPLLLVSSWVQGQPTNFDRLLGQVVLLEVFQVNCPGCFLYALPQAIDFYHRYSNYGLVVLGMATAFEDFDKNTLTNLQRLADTREVIGETYRVLNQQGNLVNGCLPYNIPFALAMDALVKREKAVSNEEVLHFIHEHLQDFKQQTRADQDNIIKQVHGHLEKLDYHAQTFELFNLKGTPSHVLVDKNGVLRDCTFGMSSTLEKHIQQLLQE